MLVICFTNSFRSVRWYLAFEVRCSSSPYDAQFILFIIDILNIRMRPLTGSVLYESVVPKLRIEVE